jgi:glutamate-1-semialdehyde 2,1-aminomutase
MFALMFAPEPVTNFEESKAIDAGIFAEFFHQVLANGVMLPPTAVDAACLSVMHSKADIEKTIGVCADALARIYK